jgi:hypothetical protein
MYGQNDAQTAMSNPTFTMNASAAINKGLGDPKVDRAPIDCGMTALQDRAENLHRLVSVLEQRFSPVLRQLPPATAAGNRPTEVVASSPVGSLLNDRISQLRDVEYRIEELLTRCEL